MKLKIKYLYVLIPLLLMVGYGFSQEKYAITAGQVIKVSGESTLNNWEMISNEAHGRGIIELKNGRIIAPSFLEITVSVHSFKLASGQMGINVHTLFNADQYPNIIFRLGNIENIREEIFSASGQLIIAGISRPIFLILDYIPVGNMLKISGIKPLQFSDFHIKPPLTDIGSAKTFNGFNISLEMFYQLANVN